MLHIATEHETREDAEEQMQQVGMQEGRGNPLPRVKSHLAMQLDHMQRLIRDGGGQAKLRGIRELAQADIALRS